MKFRGHQIKGPNCEIIVFPRTRIEQGKEVVEDIVFRIEAVLDYSEFDALCSEPAIPDRIIAGKRELYPDHPDYKKRRTEWLSQRFHWMMLQSMANSPDIEWEKVKMDDSSTWSLYEEELRDAGFTNAQLGHLRTRIISINGVDETKMEEARARFLASQQEVKEP